MIFSFLTYLQPIHYFRSYTKDGHSVFPIIDTLPEYVTSQLNMDSRYQSPKAQHYDLSWQAIQKGYIGTGNTYTEFDALPIHDNYVFIRKQFHVAWVNYVLLLRLISLSNPIKEIRAWWTTKHVKRTVINDNFIKYPKWHEFESALITSNPKISVVIPTLNRYDYLKDVLKDLELQDYKNFEVIVVDQSDDFNPEFYKNFDLNIRLIHQEEKALWLARNTAIKESDADIIALSEDDVRIESNWIRQHLKCLDFFKAQVSAGVFYPKGKRIPKNRSFFAVASQFATGNAMLYKSVFTQIGLFDRQFEKQRMGDGEFGMRIFLQGMLSVSNPLASCVDVKAGTGGLREMGSWDAFRPSTFFAPRPIPSVLYYFRRYYGKKAARLALLRTIPTSIFPYQFKKNKFLLVLGSLITLLIFPLVCYQVYVSWSQASKKIKEGPLVDVLE